MNRVVFQVLSVSYYSRTMHIMNRSSYWNYYPRRLAAEVAIWLTQEGFYNDAVILLEVAIKNPELC
jgi:hypothetical protein